jgi:hypothetical protein
MALKESTLEDLLRLAIPILVARAQARQTIFYNELQDHTRLSRRYIGELLFHIRAITISNRLPYINAIVVNKSGKMAGYPSEIEEGDKEEVRQKFARFRDQVFNYSDWRRLFVAAGLE